MRYKDVELLWMGTKVSNLRRTRNISPSELSSSIGKSSGYIKRVERGLVNMSMFTFLAICHVLRVSPEEFFEHDKGLL